MDTRATRHVEGLSRFVRPDYRAAFRFHASRGEPLAEAVGRSFDLRYVVDEVDTKTPGARGREHLDAWLEKACNVLRRWGAPTRCYVFSRDPDVDHQERDLKEALGLLQGTALHGPYVLSCVPGELLYVTPETHGPPETGYILKRHPLS